MYKRVKVPNRIRDLTGFRTGRLTVAWPAGYERMGSGKESRRPVWLCFCDCGNFVVCDGRELTRNSDRSRRSCGCVRRNIEASFVNLFAQYKHKAKERDLEWQLTFEQFKSLVTSPCHYTGRLPQQKFVPKGKNPSPSIMWNGIDRLDNSKGYIPDNCVPCWGVVNKMKLTLTKAEFLAICDEVSKFNTKGETNAN